MPLFRIHLGALVMSVLGASLALASPPATAVPASTLADHQAIEALLASYTRCVTQHDEAGFRALLLDDRIPFAAVAESKGAATAPDLRQYAGFRQAVFGSGERYRQTFSHVHVEQHGVLAQVSLDFVTEQLSGQRGSSAGWKVLQLVKVGDRWKIANELFTF